MAISPYQIRLIDDLHSSLSEALRILERDMSGRSGGKPLPTMSQVIAIRAQTAQASQYASELFGAMSADETQKK